MQMTRKDFIRGTALFGAAVAAGRVFADGKAALCLGRTAHENAAVRVTARKYIADGLYAGLACASNRGDMYLEGSLRFTGPKMPVTPDTLFDLASVGKTQTAALCALLYADGRLDVDAPFTKYIPEHVLAKENCRITVRDLRQGRSFVSTSAEPETDGCFVTDMGHPSKGRHDFVATFETAEGTYSYSFSQFFCAVWTVLPFVDGHSLYAELRGPERTVGERCELRISVDIYAVFDYTVAVERNGEKINEPARWWHFVERRGLDYTIEKGTAQGELKIQSGWVNTSVRHIKSVAEGLDWGVTGGTATRWVSSRTVQYKPQASKAGILLTLGVNESFRMAGNDVVLDLSRIQGTLDERGIVY